MSPKSSALPLAAGSALFLAAGASIVAATWALRDSASTLADALVLAAYLGVAYLPAALLLVLPFRALLARTIRATGAGLLGAILFAAAGRTPERWEGEAAAPPEPEPHPPVVLVGLDGADPGILDPGIESGELPTFARLAREGMRGTLRTLVPTDSPSLWTTVATGLLPEEHGVRDFTRVRLAGVGPWFGGEAPPSVPGWRPVASIARRLGLSRIRLVSRRERRAPAFWELASAAGEQVVAVHWWASWPATPVNGWVVTDRLAYHRAAVRRGVEPERHALTYPEGLASALAPLVLDPDRIPAGMLAARTGLSPEEAEAVFGSRAPFRAHAAESELPFLVALDETYGAIARTAVREQRDADVLAVYLRGIDVAQHAALRYDRRFRPDVPEEDARRYGEIVRRTYAWTDRWLGEFLRELPEEAIVFVVSDHGMRASRDAAGGIRFHHDDGPPGIAFVRGPGVSPGRALADPSILDIAPTLLHAAGLPVPEGWPGRVWLEAIGSDRRVRRHPTWASVTRGDGFPVGAPEVDEEAERRLRAIGYLGN